MKGDQSDQGEESNGYDEGVQDDQGDEGSQGNLGGHLNRSETGGKRCNEVCYRVL